MKGTCSIHHGSMFKFRDEGTGVERWKIDDFKQAFLIFLDRFLSKIQRSIMVDARNFMKCRRYFWVAQLQRGKCESLQTRSLARMGPVPPRDHPLPK